MDVQKSISSDSEDRTLNPQSVDDNPHGVREDGEAERARVIWLPEPPMYYRAIKRTIDIVLSLFLLVLFAPMLLMIMLAIKLTSKGPIIFRQKRLGYRGKPFSFFKFRSMYVESGHGEHTQFVTKLIAGDYGAVGERTAFKVSNDPRITRVGRLLRRTSLDELPQYLNVLRGDMSLVGPRPPIAYEWAVYKVWHKQRLSSKPGVTGLWQVSGRSSTSFDEMVKLDIEYVKHPSVLSDIRILLMTPVAVLRSDKAF